MTKQKSNSGITLVALIITIIVLLIIATVSIMAITKTGIFTKAESATQRYEEERINEVNKINGYENLINAQLPTTYSVYKNGNEMYVLSSKGELIVYFEGQRMTFEYKYDESTKEGYTNFISAKVEEDKWMVVAAVNENGNIYEATINEETGEIEIKSTPFERRDDIIKTQGTYECYVQEIEVQNVKYEMVILFDYKNNTVQLYNVTGNYQGPIIEIERSQNTTPINITVGENPVIIGTNATKITGYGETPMYIQDGILYGGASEGASLSENDIMRLDSNYDMIKLGYFVVPN